MPSMISKGEMMNVRSVSEWQVFQIRDWLVEGIPIPGTWYLVLLPDSFPAYETLLKTY